MSEASLLHLSRLWARAGAMFATKPADISPNLESLLLDTARYTSENPNFEPKYNAIRPEEWVASKNPSFRLATR